jgi:hypothetical protein
LTEEVQKLEVPHEELILDYLKNTFINKGLSLEENYLNFLPDENNLSALIFMQIIYDRAPLGLLPELVQVSFNILVGPCHPINIDSMKPN